MGKVWAERLIWFLFILDSAILLFAHPELHFVLLWCVGLGNVILFVLHREVQGADRFRMIGDALFLIPGLSLF